VTLLRLCGLLKYSLKEVETEGKCNEKGTPGGLIKLPECQLHMLCTAGA
jgi:hypothetical protein